MNAINRLIKNRPELTACLPDIQQALETLVQSYQAEGKVLLCGNGGSAADCEHLVGELMKGYLLKRPVSTDLRNQFLTAFPEEGAYLADHLQGALPAISLVSQAGLITAFANDVAPEMIFAQQVYGYGRPGDVLIAISTSGNSTNVIRALQTARILGLTTIGFTGASGGEMPGLCDVLVRVPYETTAEVQEAHLAIYHVLCADLENELFSE